MRAALLRGPPVIVGTAPSAPRVAAFVVLGAACAFVPSLAMWGFTVDDALIPARYAHHLATGHGYRFDMSGPSTDGVTPLPWPFLLAPLATGSSLDTLLRAKALGLVAWTMGGAALGSRVAKSTGEGWIESLLAAASLVVMGLAFPIGAWASSGMETGLATALATWAATRMHRPSQVAVLAGMAASLRPEMVVWAVAMAAGAVMLRDSRRLAEGLRASGLALAPFVACAGLRLVVFGRPAPLALLAKPSDLTHGWTYVAASSVVVLTPLLVCAPVALWRARGVALALVAAFVAHALAVVVAGGDWMAYARLMVPIAPSLVLAFVALSSGSAPAWRGLRLALAAVVGVVVALRAAPAGRFVYPDRTDLVVRARPVLADAHVVAALDVGWVSAATDATIVDLAGLTDPSIALLPGGHTSKRVDVAMLLDRGVDTVIVYSAPRVVENRLVRSELFEARFAEGARLDVGSRGMFYTVYRRRPP